MNKGLIIKSFDFKITNEVTLNIPAGSRLLGIRQTKQGDATLWGLVPQNVEATPRTFTVLRVGDTFDGNIKDLDFVGTFADDGKVVHLFEVLKTPVNA